MAVKKKYNTLGRGLDALISMRDIRPQGSSTINEIAIDLIEANPNQPRHEFDKQALYELAVSIKKIGLIQPITLREIEDNRFQIVAGERRWRAAQLIGLKTLPAYIRTISDESVMELALVENIQREDLNPIEIALAYQHLLDNNEGLTHENIAERVGKSRSVVSNYLRLLRLPAQIQLALQRREIDVGHARTLLSLKSPTLQMKVYFEILKHGYSVRKVEEIVNNLIWEEEKASNKVTENKRAILQQKYENIKHRLTEKISPKVQMSISAKGKGKITIPFADENELARLILLLDKIQQ